MPQEDLTQRIEKLKEKYHSALYGKSSKEIIQRLEREKSNLEKKVESLKQPPIFKRIKTRLKEGVRKEFLENITLLSAYTAEIYYLGPLVHKKFYSLADYMFVGYDGFIKAFPFIAAFEHILWDGVSGIVLGALTGATIGAFTSLTYNIIKKRDFFPIESVAGCGKLCGIAGAIGGLLGAEFTDVNGIMIGAYISSGLMVAKIVKEG